MLSSICGAGCDLLSCLAEDEEAEAKSALAVLDRWRESLLASQSLSQVFLHLSVLEKSIMWSKSALHARCRICRRKGDGEHMLLCDGCDRGHHMYCLKPPVLVSVCGVGCRCSWSWEGGLVLASC